MPGDILIRSDLLERLTRGIMPGCAHGLALVLMAEMHRRDSQSVSLYPRQFTQATGLPMTEFERAVWHLERRRLLIVHRDRAPVEYEFRVKQPAVI